MTEAPETVEDQETTPDHQEEDPETGPDPETIPGTGKGVQVETDPGDGAENERNHLIAGSRSHHPA